MTSALTGEGEVSQNRTSVSEVAWMYWISPKCGQGGGGSNTQTFGGRHMNMAPKPMRTEQEKLRD